MGDKLVKYTRLDLNGQVKAVSLSCLRLIKFKTKKSKTTLNIYCLKF